MVTGAGIEGGVTNVPNGTEKLFDDQREGEEIIYCFMEHWINVMTRVFKFLLILSFFAALAGGVFYMYSIDIINDKEVAKWALLSIIGVYMYLFHRATLNMFDLLMNIYIVTNTRIIIIDKGIFFKDDKKIIDLRKIHDISSSKLGLLQNIFNFGDMEMILASTNGVVLIKSIPRPSEIVEIIDRAKRASIERHGDEMENLGVNEVSGE